ncbi:MAG TPA: hypothetical protein VFF81_11505, partial [Noviherbaspirillum sp.]|nr:hypothetical protein [Noviherbaspirillum sp.]
ASANSKAETQMLASADKGASSSAAAFANLATFSGKAPEELKKDEVVGNVIRTIVPRERFGCLDNALNYLHDLENQSDGSVQSSANGSHVDQFVEAFISASPNGKVNIFLQCDDAKQGKKAYLYFVNSQIDAEPPKAVLDWFYGLPNDQDYVIVANGQTSKTVPAVRFLSSLIPAEAKTSTQPATVSPTEAGSTKVQQAARNQNAITDSRQYPGTVWSIAYNVEEHKPSYPSYTCIMQGNELASSGPLRYDVVRNEPSVAQYAKGSASARKTVHDVASSMLSNTCQAFLGTKEEVVEVVQATTRLGGKLAVVDNVLPSESVKRLVDAHNNAKEAEQRQKDAKEQERRALSQSVEECSRDLACLRRRAVHLAASACVWEWAGSRNIGDVARDYQMEMVNEVRKMQAMRVPQEHWSALQSLASANTIMVTKQLEAESSITVRTLWEKCTAAVQSDPQLDKIVAKAKR